MVPISIFQEAPLSIWNHDKSLLSILGILQKAHQIFFSNNSILVEPEHVPRQRNMDKELAPIESLYVYCVFPTSKEWLQTSNGAIHRQWTIHILPKMLSDHSLSKWHLYKYDVKCFPNNVGPHPTFNCTGHSQFPDWMEPLVVILRVAPVVLISWKSSLRSSTCRFLGLHWWWNSLRKGKREMCCAKYRVRSSILMGRAGQWWKNLQTCCNEPDLDYLIHLHNTRKHKWWNIFKLPVFFLGH